MLGVAIGFVGCGNQEQRAAEYFESAKSGGAPPAAAAAPAAQAGGENAAIAAKPGEPADAARLSRRVIYNATLDLTVADFSGIAEKIGRLVESAGGYVSNSSLQGMSGTRRSGTWTVRVPVERFDEFLREAGQLGEVNSLSTTSQEVTAEFYDLEARVRNKRQEEERMLAILESGTGKLEEILQVETEISRVRQEIEQLEGRLRMLKDLTALSTVTVNVTEVSEFVAATPENFPTFGERVSRAWTGTLDAMLTAGQRLVIAIVAAAPWVGVLAVPLFLLYRLLRWLSRPAAAARPGGSRT